MVRVTNIIDYGVSTLMKQSHLHLAITLLTATMINGSVCAVADTGSDMKRGTALFESSKFTQAIPLLEKVAAADKSLAPRALLLIAVAKQEMGDRKAGIAILTELLSSYPNSESAAESNYWIADYFYADANREQARIYLEKQIAQYPSSPKSVDALKRICKIYVEEKNPSGGLEYLSKLSTRQYPNIVTSVYYCTATIQKQLQNKDAALEALRRAKESALRSVGLGLDTKKALLEDIQAEFMYLGDSQAATDVDLSIIKLCPDAAAAKLRLAGNYRRSGDTSKAIDAFKSILNGKASRLETKDALVNLSECYTLVGDFQAAISTIEDIIKRYPEEAAVAQLQMANIYLGEGNAPRALSILRGALQTAAIGSNSRRDILRSLAGIYVDQKKLNDMAETYKIICDEYASEAPDTQVELASAYIRMGDIADAMSTLDLVVSTCPQDYGKRNDIMRRVDQLRLDCHLAAKDYRALIEALQLAAKNYPNEAVSYTLRIGDIYRNEVRNQELAAETYKSVVAMPTKTQQTKEAYMRLADCYLSQNKVSDALTAVSQGVISLKESGIDIIDLMFKQVSIYNQMSMWHNALQTCEEIKKTHPEQAATVSLVTANIYAAQRDITKALSTLETALETTTKGTSIRKDIMFRMAGIYTDQKRLNDAVSVYENICKEFPTDSPTAQIEMASAYIRLNKPSEAIAMLDLIVDSCPRNFSNRKDILRRVAEIYDSRNRVDKALSVYRTLLSDYPENAPSFRLSIGSLLIKQGKYDEATTTLRNALVTVPTGDPIADDLNAQLEKCVLLTSP